MPLFSAPAYAPSAASALFVSTQEAADILHVSPWTIRTLVRRGDLHVFRPVIGHMRPKKKYKEGREGTKKKEG